MTRDEWTKRIWLTLDKEQREAIRPFYLDMIKAKEKNGEKECEEEGYLAAAFMAVYDYKNIINGEAESK